MDVCDDLWWIAEALADHPEQGGDQGGTKMEMGGEVGGWWRWEDEGRGGCPPSGDEPWPSHFILISISCQQSDHSLIICYHPRPAHTHIHRQTRTHRHRDIINTNSCTELLLKTKKKNASFYNLNVYLCNCINILFLLGWLSISNTTI